MLLPPSKASAGIYYYVFGMSIRAKGTVGQDSYSDRDADLFGVNVEPQTLVNDSSYSDSRTKGV